MMLHRHFENKEKAPDRAATKETERAKPESEARTDTEKKGRQRRKTCGE